MTALIELREVSKAYGGGLLSKNATLALDDISFAIEDGAPSIIAVVGESGSGKTTLASLIMGFFPPSEGTVLYKGSDLNKLSGKERIAFRRDVQAVFQDPFAVFNPFYTVDHVLTVPIAKFKLAKAGPDARNLMEEALQLVGLRPDETLGRYPHQLSGGQRQRIIVARALMLAPRLIVADEPVSMVDASLRATILESLRKANQSLRIPILYITHDLATAYHVADHILVMYRGSVVEAGDVETIIKHPKHPYTQLLIESIPWPDPKRRWGQEADVAAAAATPRIANEGQHGCKFASRCPYVMDICVQSPPPLFQTEERHVAACFLHRDAPVVANEELGMLIS